MSRSIFLLPAIVAVLLGRMFVRNELHIRRCRDSYYGRKATPLRRDAEDRVVFASLGLTWVVIAALFAA